MPFPAMSGSAVARLVHRDLFALAGGGKHPERTGKHRRLVAQDVAEHVGGDDHVELAGVADELHRAVVDVHVLEIHVRIIAPHLGDHIPPEFRGLEDVGLVHGEQLPATCPGDLWN